jgi:regulatory protein
MRPSFLFRRHTPFTRVYSWPNLFCYSQQVAFKRTQKTYTEPELYDYSVAALGRKMRTVAELKRLLRQRCDDAEMIERVISRLKEQKYLNDSSYAAAYSSFRRDNEKFGVRRVITDLKVKGVHRDLIDKAVADAYAGVNEEALARAFLKRKRLAKPAGNREAARIFRALVRAGFSAGISIRILKNWDVEDEVLTALQEEDLASEN